MSLCSVTNPIFFLFLKGSFLRRQLSSLFLQDSFCFFCSPAPEPVSPPNVSGPPPPEGGGRGARGRVALSTPQHHGASSFREHLWRPSRELKCPGQRPPHPPQLPERFPEGTVLSPLPTHPLAIKPTEKSQLSSWPEGTTGLGGSRPLGLRRG